MTKPPEMPQKKSDVSNDIPLVNPQEFIGPFRSQGINSLEAFCEIIDNSIDAGAKRIQIDIREEKGGDVWVAFADDGDGMAAKDLEWALRIGNGQRTRTKIGRFGWGLKAASASQAKVIDVYSRAKGAGWYMTTLDYEAIQEGEREGFPHATEANEPSEWPFKDAQSGTLVLWRKTDGLDPNNPTTLRDDLIGDIGRIYRKFIIGQKLNIVIGGRQVEAIDPLYLTPGAKDYDLIGPGREFYKLKNIEFVNPVTKKTGKILFRWSWLSRVKVENAAKEVAEKRGKSINDVKRRWGITVDYQGFSIMRDGREIKWGSTLNNLIRRHPDRNYFKAEIQFDPDLDEAFGINTNKSRFFLHKKLKAKLKDELKGLRSMFEEMRSKESTEWEATKKSAKASELIVAEAEKDHSKHRDKDDAEEKLQTVVVQGEKAVEEGTKNKKDFEAFKARIAEARKQNLPLIFEAEHSPGAPFFRPLYTGETSIVYLNTASGFYKDIYERAKGDDLSMQLLELLIFSIARAEIEEHRVEDDETQNPRLKHFLRMRQEWTTYLESYLARVPDNDNSKE